MATELVGTLWLGEESYAAGPRRLGGWGNTGAYMCPQIYTHRLSHQALIEAQQLGSCDASASGYGCKILSPATCSLEAKEPKENISDILSL